MGAPKRAFQRIAGCSRQRGRVWCVRQLRRIMRSIPAKAARVFRRVISDIKIRNPGFRAIYVVLQPSRYGL